MPKIRDLQTYFWNRVAKAEGCWAIDCFHDKDGYGKISYNGKGFRAHRLCWQFSYGPIPDGLYVCHRCDNPGCVRPDHLFLGTNQQNLADMVSKNRHAKGEIIRGKLNPEKVIKIRSLRQSGIPVSTIAKQFGVSWEMTALIIRRKVWKHVA